MVNVLLAEDEKITAMDLKLGLKRLGYNIINIVDKGMDLIKEANKTNPDVIISDINLRDEISGIEAVSKILEEKDVTIVIISGFNDDTTMGAVRNLQPCAFIRKPTNARELNQVINNCLNKG